MLPNQSVLVVDRATLEMSVFSLDPAPTAPGASWEVFHGAGHDRRPGHDLRAGHDLREGGSYLGRQDAELLRPRGHLRSPRPVHNERINGAVRRVRSIRILGSWFPDVPYPGCPCHRPAGAHVP